MAFVTSTSKLPTSVGSVSAGHFTGSLEKFILLSRGNLLSVFKANKAALSDSVAHVQDFRLHCTIQCIHAVPITNPTSKQLVRHVLFILSTKQEISIVAFENDRERLRMISLFYDELNELHQPCISTVDHISCSTDSLGLVTPFVAFGVSEDLFFIDILSAIGSKKKRQGNKAKLQQLFPAEVLSLLDERGKWDYFVKRPFHPSEYEVRSLAFGYASAEVVPFYVLFSDSHGRVHIAEYSFQTTPSTKPTHSLVEWISYAGGQQKLVRIGCLQNNVDPSSSRILVTNGQLICVGSQLLTAINLGRGRQVHTLELPSTGPVASEVAAAGVLENGRDVVVCLMTGALTVVHIDGLDSEKCVEVTSYCLDIGTLPNCILPVNNNICLLSSRLEDTIVVELFSWKRCTVIENCGPVIDMTVAGDGATQTVLASTGAERRGGISIVRSVMSLTSEFVYQLSDMGTSIISEHELLLVNYFGLVSCFRLENTEMKQVLFDGGSPTELNTVHLCYMENKYVLAHEEGLLMLKWGDESKTNLTCTEALSYSGTRILFSSSFGCFLCIGESHRVTFVQCTDDGFRLIWSTPTLGGVSALDMNSTSSCVVGEWDCSVSIYDSRTQSCLGRMRTESVPRSICCVGALDSQVVLIGLVNGYLCETSTLLIKEAKHRHSFFLMNRPVELQVLKNKNAVISFGQVPLIVLVTEDGCEITGFSVDGVSSCGNITSNGENRYIFFSKLRNSLHFGTMEDSQKLNRTFIALGGTVTLVKNVPEWGGFAVSLRRNNRESIVFLPNSTIQTPNREINSSLVQQCDLLENEQSTFLEVLPLNSPNHTRYAPAGGETEPVIFAGTGFLFRDEQKARSSRIMWFSQGLKGQLNQLGERDIKGSLQCCCVIPQTFGLVSLAVGGFVFLYQWSEKEKTFVQREQLNLGLMIFNLIPALSPRATVLPSTATIVALDIRHGVFYFEINTDQGTMKVLSRDLCLRHCVAGAVLPNGVALIAETNDNIYAIQSIEQSASNGQEYPPDSSTKFKLEVTAQYYSGQSINCMHRGSFAPSSVMNEYSQSQRLLRGLTGSQIVYGTAEGGFGTVTPVDFPLYFVLRAVECALSKTVMGNGSFQSESYRDLLIPGQQRAPVKWGKEKNTTKCESATMRRRCVDGDVIESFLSLSERQRMDVLQLSSKLALSWWPFLQAASENKTAADLDPTVDINIPDPEHIQGKCNELLTKAELPLLPFTEESVKHLVFDLRRLH